MGYYARDPESGQLIWVGDDYNPQNGPPPTGNERPGSTPQRQGEGEREGGGGGEEFDPLALMMEMFGMGGLEFPEMSEEERALLATQNELAQAGLSDIKLRQQQEKEFREALAAQLGMSMPEFLSYQTMLETHLGDLQRAQQEAGIVYSDEEREAFIKQFGMTPEQYQASEAGRIDRFQKSWDKRFDAAMSDSLPLPIRLERDIAEQRQSLIDEYTAKGMDKSSTPLQRALADFDQRAMESKQEARDRMRTEASQYGMNVNPITQKVMQSQRGIYQRAESPFSMTAAGQPSGGRDTAATLAGIQQAYAQQRQGEYSAAAANQASTNQLRTLGLSSLMQSRENALNRAFQSDMFERQQGRSSSSDLWRLLGYGAGAASNIDWSKIG